MTDLEARWKIPSVISAQEMEGRQLMMQTPSLDVYGPGSHDGNNYDVLTVSSVDYWFWGAEDAEESPWDVERRYSKGDHAREDMEPILMAARLLGVRVL